MSWTTILSEPRWTPKCADFPNQAGYWEVDVFYSFVPTWWDKLWGKKASNSQETYALVLSYREHSTCLGWINAATRQELSMHTELADMLEDKLDALLREEKYAEIHKAAIKRGGG